MLCNMLMSYVLCLMSYVLTKKYDDCSCPSSRDLRCDPVPRLLSCGRGKWQLAPIGPEPLLRLLSTLSTILTDWTLFAEGSVAS